MSSTPRLPRSTPEAQGVESAAVARLVAALDREISHLHSIMIVRRGAVIAEGWWAPYRPGERHMLFSLSKSFTASAVGIAAGEGRLTLDDLVLPHFPDARPAEVGDHLAALRVRDLLCMGSGHIEDTLMSMFSRDDGDWARGFLGQPIERQPGTHFVYNSGATYMLSALLQRLTGQTLLEYLGPRLLAPLGIEGATWEACPRGVSVGGWGLAVATEDIACFGQLYLQGGVWQGRRLLPEGWAAEATRAQISNGSAPASDWEQGYGYQFWRCRHNGYRGDGAFGQYCVVLPGEELVVAITSGLGDMQPPLDILWRELLPALHGAALPEDAAAQAALAAQLAGLALPARRSAAPAPHGWAGDYAVAPNALGVTAIGMAPGASPGELTLRISDAAGEHTVACGEGAWLRGAAALDPRGTRLGPADAAAPQPIAASGGWEDGGAYVAQIWYTGAPFGLTLRCALAGDQLEVSLARHVSFIPDELPTLHGRRVA